MLIQQDDGSPVAGIFWKYEDAATLILTDARRMQESNAMSDKNDWLNDEQLELRRSREVYAVAGVVDAHYLRGQYSRAWAFWDFRPTNRRRLSRRMDVWRQDTYECGIYVFNEYIPDWWGRKVMK